MTTNKPKKMTKKKKMEFKEFFEAKRISIVNAIKELDKESPDCEGDEVDIVQGHVLAEVQAKL